MLHECTWVSAAEVAKLNPTNCKGEVGPVDMFPVLTIVKPGPGAVCFSCFQVWGEQDGVKDQNLVEFEQKMRVLQEAFADNA